MTDYSRTVEYCYGVIPNRSVHLVQFAHVEALCGRAVTYTLFGPFREECICLDCRREREARGL